LGEVKGLKADWPDGTLTKKSCKRGYRVWIRKEKFLYVLWKDTNVVCVASTIHSGRADSTVKKESEAVQWILC